MPFITNFSGGLYTSRSKFTAPYNTAVDMNNADIEYGFITGVKKKEEIVPCKRYFYIFEDQLFQFDEKTEFIEVNDRLFYKTINKPLMCVYKKYSEEDGKEDEFKLVEIQAGIENKRGEIDTVDQQDISDIRFTCTGGKNDKVKGLMPDLYEYKICYLFESGRIHTQDFSITTTEGQNAIGFKFMPQNFYYAYIYRKQDSQYHLIRRIALDIETFFQDTQQQLLGNPIMPEETTKTSVKLMYQYTYYNKELDIESQYTPISEVFEVDCKKQYRLLSVYTSIEQIATHIRVYRLGENAIKPVLIAEVPNNPKVEFVEVVDIPANTANVVVLDSSIEKYTCNKKMINITSYNGMVFGSIEDRIYHSNINSPEYWSEKNSFKLDNTCTALFPVQNGILAFTENKTFFITFSNGFPYQYEISSDIGCNSMRSCNSSIGIPIFANNKGFYSFINNSIEQISKQLLGDLVDLYVLSSYSSNGVYYASTKDVIYAISITNAVIYITKVYKDQNIDTMQYYKNSISYGHSNGILYSLFTGERGEFYYKSVVLSENDPVNMSNFSNLTIIGAGKISLTLVCNDIAMPTQIIDFVTKYKTKNKEVVTGKPVQRIPITTYSTNGVQVILEGLDKYSRVDALYIGGVQA